MLFLALAAGGAAALEVHRAIASKTSSDPDVVAMRQRQRELKEALLVRADRLFFSSSASEHPGASAPVPLLHRGTSQCQPVCHTPYLSHAVCYYVPADQAYFRHAAP